MIVKYKEQVAAPGPQEEQDVLAENIKFTLSSETTVLSDFNVNIKSSRMVEIQIIIIIIVIIIIIIIIHKTYTND